MFEIWVYSLVSVFVVSLVSLIGILTVFVKKNNLRKILLILVSFSAGALLGGSFIHLLPEIVKDFNLNNSIYLLLGIMIFFILEKFIRWRHCHIPTSKEHPHPLAFMNLIGDALHNFIDGLIIGGSYLTSISLGITTSIAVIIHEVPQEISDFGVLLYGGFSKKKALVFNFLSACLAFLGAVTSILIGMYIENFSLFLISFTAGGFIYIASSDLIPELHKETNLTKSLIQLISLVFGILIMLLFIFLE